MRIAILGSTGKTGQHILDRAIRSGHAGTLLVRDATKLGDTGDFRIVIGDVRDVEAMLVATENTDAVISSVSSGGGTLEALATNLVAAMPSNGVKRFVSLIGAGVDMPGDPRSIGRSIMLTMMRLLARDNLDDARRHSEILATSGLDWTLVRPPRLTDGPPTGSIRHGEHLALGPGHSIRRPDLADFMMRLATGAEYLRQAPMVHASHQ